MKRFAGISNESHRCPWKLKRKELSGGQERPGAFLGTGAFPGRGARRAPHLPPALRPALRPPRESQRLLPARVSGVRAIETVRRRSPEHCHDRSVRNHDRSVRNQKNQRCRHRSRRPSRACRLLVLVLACHSLLYASVNMRKQRQ